MSAELATSPPAGVDTARLVQNLAPLLSVAGGAGADLHRLVAGVVLHDPAEDLAAGEGDVVLAVGVRDEVALRSVVARSAAAGCAAVVIKAPDVPVDPASPLPVLRLAPDAVWLRVAELVRSVVTATESAHGSTTSGDVGLFELADAIAALVDAPVTIEDVHSNVLAFSRRQDEADEGRIATVLGRRVPAHYLRALDRQGVFAALRGSDDPVFVRPVEDGLVARVAVAVRAGDELLGSIWVAVAAEPDERATRALRDAARVVALHLLRRRVAADISRRLQAEHLATVLAGGPHAAEAADRLQLGGGPMRVVAGRCQGLSGDGVDSESTLDGLRDVIAFHFGVLHARTTTAVVGGVIYTVVPGRAPGGDDRVRSAATALLAQVGDRHDLVVGLSGYCDDVSGLPACRAEADRVLRALGVLRKRGGPRLAAAADVRLETLLLRVADAMRADGEVDDAPLAALIAYDAEHRAGLVDTLDTYLAVMGNVTAAAERLTVHKNTLRYRLQRIRTVSGLDLDDPDARLTAMLLLRMRALID